MILVRASEGQLAGEPRALALGRRCALVIACAALLSGCAGTATPAPVSPSSSIQPTVSLTSAPPASPLSSPTDTSPIANGALKTFCGLVDQAAAQRLLGAPIAEQRTERSWSGGALCSYSTAGIETGEGAFLQVAFDRDANLARWRPSRALTAAAYYPEVLTGLRAGDPGQEIAGIGLRAWQGSLGLGLALFAPDVLAQFNYDPRAAPEGAGTDLMRSVGAALATRLPADPGPVDACTLLDHEAIQAEIGQFVDEVAGYEPFDPSASGLEFELPPGGATACSYLGTDPLDPLGVLAWLDVVRYRTEAVRDWLRSDKSIGIATEDQRSAAAEMDAAGWVASHFVGDPLVIAGTCQVAWGGRSLFLMLEPDDVVVLQLPSDAVQATAARLAGRIVAAADAERGAPATCPPVG